MSKGSWLGRGSGKLALDLHLDEPLTNFAQRPVLVDEYDSVEKASKEMCSNNTGSVIVTKRGIPAGILTEWDILCRVVAAGQNPVATKVGEVMTSPVLSLPSTSRVGDAIRLMVNRGVRRLVIMDGEKLTGVVSQNQMIGNRRVALTVLPSLEPTKGFACPYCNSNFDDIETMSKHIDRVHIGTELLQEAQRRAAVG